MTGAHVRIEGGGAANKDKKEKAEGKDNKVFRYESTIYVLRL